MRSFLLSIAIFLLSVSPIMAQDEMGFIGPGTDTNMVKVADLENLNNYTEVMLTGNVLKKLDDRNRYQFSDGTGTVVLSVDDDLWSGLTITPNDTVELQGELRKSADQTEVEVKMIAKVNRKVSTTIEPGAVSEF